MKIKTSLTIKSLAKYISILLFLLSCAPQTFVQLPSVSESPFSIGEDRGRQRNSLRRDLTNQSEPCKDNRSCVQICDEMYLRASELNKCYNSREETVERVLDVFEELENPKRISSLSDIDVDDLKTYLKIGAQSFIDLIDPVDKDTDGDRIDDEWEDIYAYDVDNAQIVLEWVCSEREVEETLLKISDWDLINESLFEAFCQKKTGDEQTSCIARHSTDWWDSSDCEFGDDS